MIGALIKLNDQRLYLAIVLDYYDGRALVDVFDVKPFKAYRRHGYPSAIKGHVGWVSKNHLVGLRSTRILEGISVHDNTVAPVTAEVTE